MPHVSNDNAAFLVNRMLRSQIKLFANVCLRILVIQKNVIAHGRQIFGYGKLTNYGTKIRTAVNEK
jgi:hypothetical protein